MCEKTTELCSLFQKNSKEFKKNHKKSEEISKKIKRNQRFSKVFEP